MEMLPMRSMRGEQPVGRPESSGATRTDQPAARPDACGLWRMTSAARRRTLAGQSARQIRSPGTRGIEPKYVVIAGARMTHHRRNGIDPPQSMKHLGCREESRPGGAHQIAKRWDSERDIRDEGGGTVDPGDCAGAGCIEELGAQISEVSRSAEGEAAGRAGIEAEPVHRSHRHSPV